MARLWARIQPDQYIAAQSEYPESWSINVPRVIASGAEVEVPQEGVGAFRTAAFGTVDNGKLTSAIEYWVTVGGEQPSSSWAPYRRPSS